MDKRHEWNNSVVDSLIASQLHIHLRLVEIVADFRQNCTHFY